MPLDYLVSAKLGLMTCVGTGRVTGEEVFDVDRRMRADPNMHPNFDQLVDYTQATEFDVSSEEVRRLAFKEPYFKPSSNRAIVGKGSLIFGLTRMFELQRAGDAGTLRFFEDRAEAERWLAEGRKTRNSEGTHSDLNVRSARKIR